MRYCVLLLLWKLSVCLIVSLWLENWVPSKISTPSRLHYRTWSLSNKKLWLLKVSTHICNYAHRITSFIRKWFNHFGKTFRTNIFEKPFNIGSRKTFVSIETKRSVLNKYRFLSLLKSKSCFFGSDFSWFSLKFWY